MTTAATSESSEAPARKPPFILLKRPCLLIATFLIPGIVIGHVLLPQRLTIGLLLPLATSLSAALLLLAAHSTFSMPASMLVVFCVGILLGVKCDVLPPRHVHFELEADRMYRLRGKVRSEPVVLKRHAWPGRTSKERFSFDLEAAQASDTQAETSGWRTVRGKVLVYTSAGDAGQLQYGDKVELTGKAFLPNSRRNPGGFDWRKYLAEKGVYVCMNASAVRRHGSASGSPIYRLFYSLKKKIRRSFSESGLRDQEESFLRAIILGERRGVGEEFKEALRRTNTMHILAISGLHVGIIAGAMYFFLSRLLFVPQGISSLATIVILFGYALLTGMRPPVFRASIMCTAFLIAPLLRRRSDSVNSLALAAIVILFIRPGELFTAGFQLSFMVVLSILLLGGKVFDELTSLFRLRPDRGFLVIGPFGRRVRRFLDKYPMRLVSVSLWAFVGFAPLGLQYFHRISFLSPFCNVLTLFLVSFIVPLGFLAAAVGLLVQGAAGLINTLNGGLVCALQSIVRWFSALRIGSFNVSPPSLAFCFAFYSLLLLVGFSRSLRKLIIPKILMALVAAGLFMGGELARRHPDSIEITFLDVGQGDCAFVEFPDGRKMLVDGGSMNRSNVGRYVIVPFLRWAGVNKLDAILITHYDADHINGLEDVLDEVRTRTVVARAAPDPPDTSTVRNLLEAISKSKGMRLETVRAGDKLSVSPPVEGEILNPSSHAESSRLSENDLSVVLKLGFRGSSVLLCGDIERRAEGLIVRRPISLRSDVLKVPHHGSNFSSSEEFIRHASPRIGIISCGRNNIYGHPSPKVLERYHQLGVRLFRTDRDGGIVVRVFKDKLRVATTL